LLNLDKKKSKHKTVKQLFFHPSTQNLIKSGIEISHHSTQKNVIKSEIEIWCTIKGEYHKKHMDGIDPLNI
jgi:hypothetical protein